MNFITGATGFLGSYLVKNLLKRGKPVRALKRITSNFDLLGDFAKQVQWADGDLLDIESIENALDGADRIYHCAGFYSSKDSEHIKIVRNNVTGTANLFNAALHKKIKKVIHVSSVAALGLPLNGKTIDESYFSPSSQIKFDYYKSKRFAEMEAWRAHAEGLNVVIVNPSGLLGAGHWRHEPLNVFPTVYGGLSFYTEGSNGFVDVRDTAEIMVRLMEGEIAGERFIISAENLVLKDFLFLVADALNVKRPSHKVNTLLGEFAWRFEGIKSGMLGRPADFTRDDIRIARIPFTYSNEKIKKALGFSFRHVGQSIHETAQAFLESKKAGRDYASFD